MRLWTKKIMGYLLLLEFFKSFTWELNSVWTSQYLVLYIKNIVIIIAIISFVSAENK